MSAKLSGLAAAIKKNEPENLALEDQTILLYGREKIGKSTLAASFDKPIFLEFEAGLRNISCDKISCPTWKHATGAVDLLRREDHGYLVVVVDTVGRAWDRCRADVLAKNGWSHEQEGGYGRGYDAIRDEFRNWFDALVNLGLGVVLIAHDQSEEITKPTKVVSYTSAKLDKRCRSIIVPEVEMVLFADTETTKDGTTRVLRTKRTEYFEAGDRSGRLPESIPLSIEALREGYGK